MKALSRCALVAVVLSLVLSACAGAAGDRKESGGLKSVTAVGGGASMSYAVPQLLKTMEIDKKHGLDLDYTGSGTSSTNMVAAVLSGDADFAFPASTTALDAIEEGGDLVIVASALKAASILGVSTEVAKKKGVSADAPVKERIAALKGLKVATSPEGSGNNALFRMIVSAAGLDPDKDLEVIGVQEPSAIVSGIKQGQFDAGFYGSGVIEANIAAGEAELWLSTARGDVDELIGEQMGMVMVTSKRLAEAEPELVSAMFDAVVETERTIADDPKRAGQELQKAWFADLDQKIYDVAWREAQHAYPSDGRFTKKQFQTLLDMLAAAGKKYTINYDDVVYDRAVG